MTARPTSLLAVVRLGLIAVTVGACGTANSYQTTSGSTTTLMAGWERHFTIDWTVEPDQGGALSGPWPRSTGHGESPSRYVFWRRRSTRREPSWDSASSGCLAV